MTDIRQLEQSIIRPQLMIDLIEIREEETSPRNILIKDILIGIFIALILMQ